MPNGVLISQVMLEANYLKEVAEEYRKYRPSVTVVANVKNGIIDDESLGLNWAANYIKAMCDKIESIADLALLKWIGSITPEEDPIEWVKAKVEAFAEWYSEVNAFSEWYVDKYCPANTSLQLASIQKHLTEMLRVKDDTSKELRAEIDVLATFLIKEMPDKIVNDGACRTAIQIIEAQDAELSELGEYLLSLMTPDDLSNYQIDKDKRLTYFKSIINRDREEIKTLKSHLGLKNAAFDDAMKQFKEATHKANENADLLTQAGERMAVLNPNPGNFDQLLKIVLAYVVNTPQLVTVSQNQLLKAIGMINI